MINLSGTRIPPDVRVRRILRVRRSVDIWRNKPASSLFLRLLESVCLTAVSDPSFITYFHTVRSNKHKYWKIVETFSEIEPLPQTQAFLSLYLCNTKLLTIDFLNSDRSNLSLWQRLISLHFKSRNKEMC